MSGLAGHLDGQEHRALAAGHDVARRAPGLGVEHRAGAARRGLDHRARGGRGDLLVRGEEADQRARRAADAGERLEHEGVHHQARLHVGDAGAVGPIVLDPERPLRGGALREHRVAMAEQQDVRVARRPGWRAATVGLDRDAAVGLRDHLARRGRAPAGGSRMTSPARATPSLSNEPESVSTSRAEQLDHRRRTGCSSQPSSSASRALIVIAVLPASGAGATVPIDVIARSGSPDRRRCPRSPGG